MTQYTPEEIEEHRRQWLEALRSGQYKQVGGALAKEQSDGSYAYCCLGVACEVAGVAQGRVERHDGFRRTYGEGKSDLTLPPEVQDWLGVNSDSPLLNQLVDVEDSEGIENTVDSLTELNDYYSWTFEQIADAIERYGLE